jgi:hypothetical protein
MSNTPTLTQPGVYSARIAWASNATTKTGTSYINVLLITDQPDERKVFGKLWTSPKAKEGAYWAKLLETFSLSNIPTDPGILVGKRCTITVNQDGDYLNVDDYAPDSPNPTADEMAPEEINDNTPPELPPNKYADTDVPF